MRVMTAQAHAGAGRRMGKLLPGKELSVMALKTYLLGKEQFI